MRPAAGLHASALQRSPLVATAVRCYNIRMYESPNNRRRQKPTFAPPLARPPRPASRDRRLVGVILLLLVLLLGGLLVHRLRRPQPVAPVTPAAAVEDSVRSAPDASVRDAAATIPARTHRARAADPTGPDGPTSPDVALRPPDVPSASAANAPAADVVRRLRPANRPPRKVVPGIRLGTNAVNPLATLRTTSERVISQLLRTPPGDPVLPIGLGADFARDFSIALTNPIVIYETDTPDDIQHKEAIAVIKDEMRQMVEQGESPETILQEYRREMNELAAYRRQLQEQLNALRRAGDMEGAALFVEEANMKLAEYGIRPLVLSPFAPRGP